MSLMIDERGRWIEVPMIPLLRLVDLGMAPIGSVLEIGFIWGPGIMIDPGGGNSSLVNGS